MLTGWTLKKGVNILPDVTLEAGLTSACKMKISKHAGHILPAPTERQRQGRVGSEHRKVSTAPVCFHAQNPELQGLHFWWPRWSSFMKSYICIFKSSLTLDLSWQHMQLPWPGLQAHWNCMKIWCLLDHALSNVHWEYCPPILIIYIITHPTGFFTKKQAILSLLFPPNVLLFSCRKSRFYDKSLISGWRQLLSQLCNTE